MSPAKRHAVPCSPPRRKKEPYTPLERERVAKDLANYALELYVRGERDHGRLVAGIAHKVQRGVMTL